MLTIKSIGTDPKRQLYYDSQIAQGREDYYAGNGEAPGEFVGTGTQALGLTGEITRDQLIAMFAGKDPTTGQQLAKRTARSSVTGFDLTFSAPKSISVLYAVGGDELARLLTGAHDEAVREALAYMESNAARVRRGHNGTQAERDRGDARGFERARSVAAEGFVAGAYRHRMSRNQDPQLHTHVVVMNMAKGPDGRFTALDGQHLYAHVKATGFVYQAHLRQAVRQRREWVDWGTVRNGMAELTEEQVSVEVLKRFSSRRAEIVEKAHALVGAGTRIGPKGMERIALDTREAKREINDADWHELVRAIAAEHGLGRDQIAALDRLEPAAWDAPLDEVALADELFSPEGLTNDANTFHERDVIMRIAAACRQGLTVAEIRAMARRVMAHGQVVAIPDANDRRFTTAELLEREAQIIDLADAGRDQSVAVLTPAQVAPALAGLPFQLSDEQMRVLLGVAGSGHQIDTVEALAGTGKTTTANAIRLAYEAAGYKVIGAAPTGRAQTELLERAGITDARTIDSWLLAMDRHPHGPDAVFAFATGGGASARRQSAVMVLDEAGMAHTRKSAHIIQAAVDAGIKVIAVGDSGQLSSVGAGGWLGAITRILGSHELREVMRQRDAEERRLLAQVHHGQPKEYLAYKQSSGDLRVFDGELEEIEAAILDASITDLLAKRDELAEAGRRRSDAVLISRDNPRRHVINDLVRARLREREELGHAIWIDTKDWAVGDQVIARRNDKQLNVHNGLRSVVVAVDEASGLTIQVEDDTLRTLPIDYVSDHVQYAYALTGHGMQAGTVEWAGVVGNAWDFSRNWSYTALSRSRERTRIYLAGGLSPSEVEQEEIGPKIEQTVEPVERMARRMRVRDDENLALEQLDAAERDWYGRGHDPALSLEDRAPLAPAPAPDPVVEPTAAPVVSPLRAELYGLRSDAEAIHAFLSSAEVQEAHRYTEATTALARIDAESAGDPPRGPLGRGDWQQRDRSRQERSQALRARQAEALRGVADPDAVLAQERAALALDRRGELMARNAELRAEAIAYELAHPPVCLDEVLGPIPSDPRQHERWEQAAQRVLAHRIDQRVTDPAALGIYADDTRLIAEINRARVDLGLEPFDQDRGPELGL